MVLGPERELVAEHVLRCVENIPPGQVATYGDVGVVVGVGPRQVGRIVAGGGGVPWWRVTNVRGELPAHLVGEARGQWADEGVAARGLGCDIARHRVDRAVLADAYAAAAADLPALPVRRGRAAGQGRLSCQIRGG